MKGVSVVRSPWNNQFKELVLESEKLDFTSPFIKIPAVNEILENEPRVRGITVFNYPRFIRGASDIEAIQRLLDYGSDLRSYGPLHAKIYIFDTAAVVTSANLTQRGLIGNEEYGVLISDEKLLAEISRDFENLFKNSSKIHNQWISFVKKILDSVSPVQKKLQIEFEREVPPDEEIVAETLSGWMKEVYHVINKLPDDDFSLSSMYDYTGHFSNLYPENQHIHEKIRQTLQYLRDMGLVEFLDDRGNYRRRR